MQKDNKSWANDRLFYTIKSYMDPYDYLIDVNEAFPKTQHLFMMQPQQIKIKEKIFWFFETGLHCVAMTVLELTL